MPSVIRGADNFDSGQVIGQGQTWQDVTASRSAGVTYTNNTGKPIMVVVQTVGITNTYVTFSVSGVSCIIGTFLNINSGYVRDTLPMIVPNGETYVLTNTSSSIEKWLELR